MSNKVPKDFDEIEKKLEIVLVGILDYKSCSILPIYHSFKSQNAKK